MAVASWFITINCLGCFFCLFVFVKTTISAPAPVLDDSIYDKIEKINENSRRKLFEGDILPDWFEDQVVNEKQTTGTTKRDAKRYAAALWPTRVIPYEITSDFSTLAQRNTVLDAFKVFEEKTCLTFKERTTEKHWLKFQRLDGCYSNVGRNYNKEGGQIVSLGSGCLGQSTILHEIMHAVGFWHEQSRPDRDKYVEIFWENIDPSQMHNFNKYSHQEADLLGVSYDYQTLMHYGRYAFSKNGKKTMQAIGDSNMELGQSLTLGTSDLIQLNALYDCASKGKSIWSTWSSYSPCDDLCYRTRHRFCSHQNITECVSADRFGVETERLKCTNAECYVPVDGHWGRWSSWSQCDKECGTGKQNRTRVCDNPAPKHGGQNCPGVAIGENECKLKTCGLGEYDCEFEGQVWCKWTVDSSNQGRFTWTRQSGGTPSGNTGPTGDHTLGSGHYIYTESSVPAITGDIARVSSPEIPATTGLCLKFWYHMFGSTMGSLRVVIKDQNGVEKQAWIRSGDQGNQWLLGNKTIESQTPFKVIFEATRGSNYLSDISVDDIKIEDGSCEKSALETKCGVRMKPLGCFEDSGAERAVSQMQFSYRVPGGYVIDWNNYQQSLDKVVCDCAKAAQNGGSKYLAVQYYAECWTGSSTSNYTRHGSSTNCVDGLFNECSSVQDKPCTGGSDTNYVYELI